jgi:hypothetical protein
MEISVAKPIRTPSKDFLLECFSYDWPNGTLRWKVRPRTHFTTDTGRNRANGKSAGKLAGAPGDGKIVVRIDGVLYALHRLIWKIETGEDIAEIDHADTDWRNNRFSNLRPSEHWQNGANRPAQSNSTSGIKGVHRPRSGRWVAKITVRGKHIQIGRFDTAEEAGAAYHETATRLLGEFARFE